MRGPEWTEVEVQIGSGAEEVQLDAATSEEEAHRRSPVGEDKEGIPPIGEKEASLAMRARLPARTAEERDQLLSRPPEEEGVGLVDRRANRETGGNPGEEEDEDEFGESEATGRSHAENFGDPYGRGDGCSSPRITRKSATPRSTAPRGAGGFPRRAAYSRPYSRIL